MLKLFNWINIRMGGWVGGWGENVNVYVVIKIMFLILCGCINIVWKVDVFNFEFLLVMNDFLLCLFL